MRPTPFGAEVSKRSSPLVTSLLQAISHLVKRLGCWTDAKHGVLCGQGRKVWHMVWRDGQRAWLGVYVNHHIRTGGTVTEKWPVSWV